MKINITDKKREGLNPGPQHFHRYYFKPLSTLFDFQLRVDDTQLIGGWIADYRQVYRETALSDIVIMIPVWSAQI